MSAFAVKNQIIQICQDRHIEPPPRLNKMSEKEAQRTLDRLVDTPMSQAASATDVSEPVKTTPPAFNPPDQVVESLKLLHHALLCYCKRRLFIAMGHKPSEPEARAYALEAERALDGMTRACLNVDGTGHERAAKLMNSVNMSLLDVQNRFVDYLVSNATLNTLLSEKATAMHG